MLVTALLVSAVWAAVAGGYVLTRPQPFDPFGEYPVQDVNEPAETVSVTNTAGTLTDAVLPAVHVSENRWPLVDVSGRKCLNHDADVFVDGAVWWRNVEPPGFNSMASSGTRDATPGCVDFQFDNTIPADVRERVRNLAAEGITVSIWQIQGYETPSDGGVKQSWSTQNFALIWEE